MALLGHMLDLRARLWMSLLLLCCGAVLRTTATSQHISVDAPDAMCVMADNCSCAVGWWGRQPVGEERARRLVLAHVPKTGGSSIGAWGYKHKIRFSTKHVSHCASNNNRSCAGNWFANSTRCGAVSIRHCVSSYAAAHADPAEQTFSFVRDVVSRAVSSYNFRTPLAKSGPDKCRRQELARWIAGKYLHHVPGDGDDDNHDEPQSSFAAVSELVFCFERLQADFTELMRRARKLAAPTGLDLPFLGPRGRVVPLTAAADADKLTALPHFSGAPFEASRCTVADLPDALGQELRTRYAEDHELHQRVCATPVSEAFALTREAQALRMARLDEGFRGRACVETVRG
uniref:Uncharacterized protein n=1 Tax=Calcidiscus leptoporus TaxID=127549 RepID=A0A7S0JCP8_9EUKA